MAYGTTAYAYVRRRVVECGGSGESEERRERGEARRRGERGVCAVRHKGLCVCDQCDVSEWLRIEGLARAVDGVSLRCDPDPRVFVLWT